MKALAAAPGADLQSFSEDVWPIAGGSYVTVTGVRRNGRVVA